MAAAKVADDVKEAIEETIVQYVKPNPGFGQDKYPHQINVKLTDEDMKQIDTINENYFGGDASGSMVIRALVRTAFKNYPERK